MNTIIFDEKYFDETGMIFWIFDNDSTECSNEEIYRKIVPGVYIRKQRITNTVKNTSSDPD